MSVSLVAEHQSQQTIDQTRIGARATDRYVRHNPHVSVADDLHELHDRIALRAQRLDADPVSLGFRRSGRPNGFSIAMRSQPHCLSFAGGLLDLRVRVQLCNAYALLSADYLLLDVCQRGL